jgi:CBS domain-containing protein
MKVSEIMSPQVVTATPQTTVVEAARQMSQIDSGALPVVDKGKVVGFVTDRDIVVRAVAKGTSLDAPVSGIMSDDIHCCRADDSVAEAAAHMGSHQIRRLVVLDDGGKLAGIISLGDIALDYGAKGVGHTLEEISADPAAAH